MQQFYDGNMITVFGTNCPKPILTFQEACFPGKYLFDMILKDIHTLYLEAIMLNLLDKNVWKADITVTVSFI